MVPSVYTVAIHSDRVALTFEALCRFVDGPIESQRTLADSLGISLGKA